MPSLRIVRAALALVVLLLPAAALAAGDDPYAVPTAWTFDARPLEEVPTLVLPELDRGRIAAEDALAELDGLPRRFAIPYRAGLSSDADGLWERTDFGDEMWRSRIQAPGAYSLNFGFTRYELPEGARLLLYSSDGTLWRGPFIADDAAADGQLWTPVLLADDVVVELTVPAGRRAETGIELGWANQGYRGFGAPRESVLSGACNMDIECLPGNDPWRTNARAVAVYQRNGSWTCTGSLLNNTALDRRLFFMTAAHCGVNSGNAGTVVAYWNYRNSTCRTPGGGASGGPGDGSLAQFYSGATFRAGNSASDFTLIEFEPAGGPDPAFAHRWAGWDRSSEEAPCATGTLCAGIHHPSTDEMRITFSDQPTQTSSWGGTPPPTPGDGTHVWVHWNVNPPYFPDPPGVTEPGSSGSPFYDEQLRFIGQLHGGASFCGATGQNLSDIYGRFSVSWTGGGSSSTRVSDWLDPINSGVVTLDGVDLCAPPDPPTGVVATANGDNRIDVSWNPVSGAQSYRLFRSPEACPGGVWTLLAEDLTATSYSDLTVLGGVTYAYRVTTVDDQPCESAPSLCDDATATGGCPPPAAPSLTSPPDGATGVSTSPTLIWTAVPSADDYTVEVDDDPGFGSPEFTDTVAGTSTVAGGLAASTTYHWRVTANNACGPGAPSTAFSFTTGLVYCRTPGLAIPDDDPAGATDVLAIPAPAGEVTDLDVSLVVTHTWVGDLAFTLEHDDTGTAVTFFDRPGVPASTFGCSGDDIDATLDDEAATPVESECGAGTPTIAGSFVPNNPLSAFDGEDLGGSWTLTAADHAGGDTGTVDEWCLLPTIFDPMPFLDGFESGDTSAWSSTVP